MKQISVVLGTERDEVEVIREVRDRVKGLLDVKILGYHTKEIEKFEKNRGVRNEKF